MLKTIRDNGIPYTLWLLILSQTTIREATINTLGLRKDKDDDYVDAEEGWCCHGGGTVCHTVRNSYRE